MIGGDGSILHQASEAHRYQIPILGVNIGRIGFLADLEVEDEAVIQAVLQGHYIRDERMIIRCKTDEANICALNEFMVNKSEANKNDSI